MLKRGIYITVLVFLLTGWWFVRTAVLYDGDFLGLYAPNKYGEMYAQEEFKPSNRESVQEQGISLEEMLKTEDEGGMDWMRTTWRSFIGYFGFLEEPLGLDIYEIHKKIFALGFLGIGLYADDRLRAQCHEPGEPADHAAGIPSPPSGVPVRLRRQPGQIQTV